MFSVIAVDSSDNQWRPQSWKMSKFGYALNAGCTATMVKVPTTNDLPVHLDRLEIWDNLNRLWFGQIEDIQDNTDMRETTITALGFSAYLKEIDIARLWMDTGFADWDLVAPVPWPDNYNIDVYERDNNNRVFIRLRNGASVISGNFGSIYYRSANDDRINQDIFSVTFDWEIGSDVPAGMHLRLYSYSSDFSTRTQEFTQAGAGTLSGSEDIEITAGQKGLEFRFHSSTNHTATNDNSFIKLTNVRVNGLTAFEVADTPRADDLIKDMLTNFAPLISTDQTGITAGTFTITDFKENGSNVLNTINRVNEVEDYHWKIDEISDTDSLPRFDYKAIDRGTIDYTLDQTMGKFKPSGTSLENVFNAVRVWYQKPNGNKTSVTRTSTVTLLGSRTKTAHINIITASLTKAQETGDIFLTEHARPKVKGTYIATGDVFHNTKGFLSSWLMRPGEIVHIRDHDPTPATLTEIASADVLNGRNVFMIKRVDVDPNKRQTRLELDVTSNRLDIMLARQGIS